MAGDGFGRGIVFETLLENPLHAINIKEFKTQCALTGGIQSLGTIAVGKTE